MTGLLYLTDAGRDIIQIMDFDRAMTKTVVSEDLDEPREIILHPKEG